MSTAPRQRKYGHQPERKRYGSYERPIIYHLEVDEDEYVVVSATPLRVTLEEGEWIKFESNKPNAAIRFLKTSPFHNPDMDKGEPRAWQIFELGTAGRMCEVMCPKGFTTFECGYINEHGDFEVWPGEGSGTGGGEY